MDAQMLREDLRKLVAEGKTTLENCEKLVLIKKALKIIEEAPEAAAYAEDDGIEKDPLTKDQVVRWVGAMENADGTRGGHWSMEATEQVRKQRGIDCNPVMFYAAMNMMYSDYCKAAEKLNFSTPDFYACMAKAFLEDKDAKPHKLARYYRYIVEQ